MRAVIKELLVQVCIRKVSDFSFAYTELDKLWFWGDPAYIQEKYQKFQSTDNLKQLKERVPNYENFRLKAGEFCTFSSVDAYLLPIIENNPSTKFYLLMIPYPFHRFKDYDTWERCFLLQRYLVEKMGKCENVEIYGWHDCNFVRNVANYCDGSHYHPDINRSDTIE